jgi:pimeloyl-ACP methyl ester carboxylesterase
MPILHFSHANGFPAPCYRKMFSYLEREFRIGYVERIGHDPRHPVTDGWPRLVDELVERIATDYREPVVGVGHSLGGYLTLKAALRRPELFRSVIVIDSPIPKRWSGTALQMVKRFGLVDRITPAGITRGRRAEWPSVEAAIEHFRGKRNFRDFDPDCLRDYATLGMVPTPHGVALAFDPEVEYRIYRTIPHDVVRDLPALSVPAGFLSGSESGEMRRPGLVDPRRHFRTAQVSGSHLFPFERPEETAGAISKLARELTHAAGEKAPPRDRARRSRKGRA